MIRDRFSVFLKISLDWFVLVEKTETDQLLTRWIVSFRRIEECYRKDEEVHELRLCPVRDVLTDLAEAGFQAEVLRALSGFSAGKHEIELGAFGGGWAGRPRSLISRGVTGPRRHRIVL